MFEFDRAREKSSVTFILETRADFSVYMLL